MKTFTINQWESSTEVFVRVGTYPNGRVSISLFDTEDGCPYAIASVNLPDVLLADNEVLIKDYSENEGILDFLLENKIVSRTENGVQSGFVWIPVCTLNDESVWGQLDPAPDQINLDNGKKMWLIKDYRIWANTYQEALSLLPLIESC
jgi:hypothetical protein